MRTILASRPSTTKAIELIERGLPWSDAEALAGAFDISLERVASLLDIPQATFFRRKKGGRFTKQESDHLLRFARLWWIACDVFENEEGARAWLKMPQFGLRGAIPLEYAATEAGAREVEDLLRRIDFGLLA
jgi:putative toxin-antitoxin system antitoxin component (TIGR02293 family)